MSLLTSIFTMPSSPALPPFVPIYLQAFVPDFGALKGIAHSNALQLLAAP